MTSAEVAARAEALSRERETFAAALRSAGPDAPTLIDRWSARDLAAHVAATEQVGGLPTFVGRTLVARGVRLNDTFKPVMAFDLRRFRRHGFEWALRRLERPGPRLLDRAAVLPVSVFEIFVHHEDLRRANAMTRPAPELDLVPSIEWLLRYHRRPLGDHGVRFELPGGRVIRGGGSGPELVVTGTPAEALLWLAGRREHAAVSVTGSEPGSPRLVV